MPSTSRRGEQDKRKEKEKTRAANPVESTLSLPTSQREPGEKLLSDNGTRADEADVSSSLCGRGLGVGGSAAEK